MIPLPDASAYGSVIVLVSIVTAAFSASALPCRLAPVVSVIESWAIMVPTKAEFVPRVAELPTCQNTLLATTPPVRTTCVPDNVVSVEPIWKTKTSLELPVRVRVPVVIPVVLEVLYVPAASVRFDRSPGRTAGGGETTAAAKL